MVVRAGPSRAREAIAVDPDDHFAIVTGIAKTRDPQVGAVLGIVHGQRRAAGRLHHQLLKPLTIRTVGHTKGDVQTDDGFIQAPVDHLTVHELGIGDEDVHVIVGLDLGIAHAELDHHPMHAVFLELDVVTHLDAAFEQQNEARGKVAEDILQTKAEAHADYAAKDGQTAQIDAQGL